MQYFIVLKLLRL